MSSKPSPKKITCAGLGMGIGLFFGGILGVLAGNLVVFAGGGMILGLGISITIDGGTKGIFL